MQKPVAQKRFVLTALIAAAVIVVAAGVTTGVILNLPKDAPLTASPAAAAAESEGAAGVSNGQPPANAPASEPLASEPSSATAQQPEAGAISMSQKPERTAVGDVEAEVLRIRGIWTADRDAQGKDQYQSLGPIDGAAAFGADGKIRIIEVAKGASGIDYARTYQFEDGQLIFAYFEGAMQERLYFKDGWLFRWRHTAQDGTVTDHDNEPSSAEYLVWEARAWDEANALQPMFRSLMSTRPE
jgi:hypothetical protein